MSNGIGGFDMGAAIAQMQAMLTQQMEFQAAVRKVALEASLLNASHASQKTMIQNIGQA